MKRILIFIALLAGGGLLGACEKYLDKTPDETLPLELAFSNRADTERFLYAIYSYMPVSQNLWTEGGEPFDGLADEVDITWNRSNYPTFAMNLGNWGPSANRYDRWGYYYRAFRQMGIFLANVDKSPIEASLKEQYKAEVYFLRGYYYLWLLRTYGPVPLVTEVQSIDTQTFEYARNSFDEVLTQILKDFDAAAAVLPLKHENIWAGKPTKGAALALKARALLWAASPLNNGNSWYSALANADGKKLFPTAYNAARWSELAAACKAVLDLNQYELYRENGADGKPSPLLSYKNLFLAQYNQREIIFGLNLSGGSSNDIDRHTSPRSKGGWNGIGVTQELVDRYEMANGRPISDPASGYVETGFSTTATPYAPRGTWNMYVGREPRFYASVTYTGAVWFDNTIVDFAFRAKDGKAGGRDDHSRTGYLVRKFNDPANQFISYRARAKLFPLMRLADVYLMYAEALNETDGPTPAAQLYLNKVRERAGLPAVATTLSKEQLRERILHERAIELAFEHNRYFDLRRMKKGELMGGAFHGMDVDRGNTYQDADYYKRTVFETRVFEQKHYLWPIPQAEIDRLRTLVQNPGW